MSNQITTESGITDPKHREVIDGFHWTQECIYVSYDDVRGLDAFDMSMWLDPGNEIHGCQNAFLLKDERSLLFDTLTQPHSEEVIQYLDNVLAGDTLDYLVISHPEANHAGNSFTILEEYPEATLVVPAHAAGPGDGFGAEHELYHIAEDVPDGISNEISYVNGGEEIDLGAFMVEFVTPVFADHSYSIWMIEQTHNILFTVDWMGFQHQSTDCTATVKEFKNELTVEQMYRFNAVAFPWIQFSELDRITDAVDQIANEFKPEVLAPAHGTVILEDVDEYMEMYKETAEVLSEQGKPVNIQGKLEYILRANDEEQV